MAHKIRGIFTPNMIPLTDDKEINESRTSMESVAIRYTAVKVDYPEIGRAAANALFDRLGGETENEWFEPLLVRATELVDRETTVAAVD